MKSWILGLEKHMEKFPMVEPYERGMLDVGDGQQIYWERRHLEFIATAPHSPYAVATSAPSSALVALRPR